MLMADLGAEVIKVEPPGGEVYRRSGPTAGTVGGGKSLNSVRFSRRKQSIVVDLKKPGGCEVLRDLVAASDVLIENFRPGVLRRLGFGPDALSELNPRLIYASISGYGHDDILSASRSNLPAYALVVEALAGLTYLAGEEDSAPYWMGFAMADILAGVLALTGVTTALYDRERTGRGGRVDIAMADGALLMNDLALLSYSALGQVLGHGHYAYQAPWGVFAAADGYVAIAVMTTAQWTAMAEVIERPDLGADPAYATGVGRSKMMNSVLKPAVEAWTGQRSCAEIVEVLARVSVAAARVNTSADLVADAGFVAREMLVEVDDPVIGPVTVVGNPIKVAGSTPAAPSRTARLGEHTDEVLKTTLGYDDARVAKLREIEAIA